MRPCQSAKENSPRKGREAFSVLQYGGGRGGGAQGRGRPSENRAYNGFLR